MAHAWKACWVNSPRGFESPILRAREASDPREQVRGLVVRPAHGQSGREPRGRAPSAPSIEHPEHRERVLAIGNRLEVLKHYPTPPGCTSPYVPLWVEEIVRRRSA